MRYRQSTLHATLGLRLHRVSAGLWFQGDFDSFYTYHSLLDDVESVGVTRPLCVKVGQHGRHAAKNHAEKDGDT